MALPKLDQPTFTLTIPSTGKEVRYRPFTVREEKIILVAQESGDLQDYVNAFKQMIVNCLVDDVDVDALASFDIEYIFLNLRAKSISNVVEMKILDKHEKQVDATINLNNVQVHKSAVSNKIVLDEAREIGVKMKYPSFMELESLAVRDQGEFSLQQGLELIAAMVDLVWEGENVYTDSTRAEILDFLADFNVDQMTKINEFLSDLPYVYVDLEFQNSQGETETRRIAGIRNFFA